MEEKEKTSTSIRFHVIREIPFIDPYNYSYEKIDKVNEKKVSNNISSSESSSSDQNDTSSSEELKNPQKKTDKSIRNEKNYINSWNDQESSSSKGHKENSRNTPNKKKLMNEFIKQCEFNADGSCYYTISNDNYLKLFSTDTVLLNFLKNQEDGSSWNVQQLKEQYNQIEEQENLRASLCWSYLKMNEHIYDCKFYPFFDWNSYNTCFFAVSTKNKPVYLHSAYDSSVLLSFDTVTEKNELNNCYSLCFHPSRNWLLCGCNRSIQVFDITAPQEIVENRILSTRKGKGQKGIISTMQYKTEGIGANSIYAVGDYNDGLYIYADECNHKNDYVIKFDASGGMHSNGITHIKWFDEFRILCGSRNSSHIFLFDIRNKSTYESKFERLALTNQKYSFDVYERYLLAGDTYGYVNVYDVESGNFIQKKKINKYSPIVSVYMHPQFPILLTGSGTRRFFENNDYPVDLITNIFYTNEKEEPTKIEQGEEQEWFPSKCSYINSVSTILFYLKDTSYDKNICE